MELRQLRYFVAVAKHLHFNRAAAELHIAQPPLSQQVARLEAELGVRLFERTSRQVSLTAEGHELLAAAQQVLQDVDLLRELADRLVRGTAGTLRVGFVYPTLNLGLSSVIGDFRRQYPAVDVQAIQVPNFDHAQAVLDKKIDIGVTMLHADTPGIVEHHLADHPIAVVLPAGHPLAGARRLSLRELADETFIAPTIPTESSRHDYLLHACAEAGIVPRVLRHGPQLSVMMHMVAAGFGITLATEADQPPPGTVLRRLTRPKLTIPMSLIHAEGALSPPAETFRRFVLDSPLSEHTK